MKKELYDVRKDSDYEESYIDIDEWRERVLSDGRRIPFRYIHGGVKKKGLKYSFCFPKKEEFRGRFFQYLSPFPGPDEEMASFDKTGADDKIAFALTNGAYFVESNMASTQTFGVNPDPQSVWKASAAAAEHSRDKAMEIYGCDRPFGYVYGGSGGSYKTFACMENTNSWDGAAPYVCGSPVSLPNSISLRAQGQRCLRHVFGKIADALDAGGSGNMYEGLNEEEAFMLREITAMGLPPQSWYLEAQGIINDGSLPVLAPIVKMTDPQYFEDFWTKEGYLGADPENSASKDRLQFKGTVKSVHVPGKETKAQNDGRNTVDTAWQKLLSDGHHAWIELEDVPKGEDLYLQGVKIELLTGEAKGKQLLLGEMIGHCLIIGMCYGMDSVEDVMEMIKPGDILSMDNSDYIAIQSYYRHQVPADLNFHAWDQFRDENGNPTLPQRANEMGYGFSGTGTVQDGNIQGKVILTQALMDESTWPWCGDWYRNAVIRAKGNDDDFRLYYMERCLHGDLNFLNNSMIVNYVGALHQALLDVSDWVERGIEPLSGTVYSCRNGQIRVEETIEKRKGMQPGIHLSANGESCTHVKKGEEVCLLAEAEVPEGAGSVTAIEFDFTDTRILPAENVFQEKGVLKKYQKNGLKCASAGTVHIYDKPGTYFAAARVKSERNGDANAIYTQVCNLARVRIIVEE